MKLTYGDVLDCVNSQVTAIFLEPLAFTVSSKY